MDIAQPRSSVFLSNLKGYWANKRDLGLETWFPIKNPNKILRRFEFS